MTNPPTNSPTVRSDALAQVKCDMSKIVMENMCEKQVVPAWRGYLASVILPVVAIWMGGCGGFFAQKPTELESRNILRKLMVVKETTGAAIQKPDFYIKLPQITEGTVAGKKEFKLYYFCKYHRAGALTGMISTQFAKPVYNKGGNSVAIPAMPLVISSNAATEQIIITCLDRAHAEMITEFLQMVDVPPIQVKISCLISEVYADHTLDWETNLEIQNLLGGEINLVGKLPGAALRDLARDSFGLEAGYITQADQVGHKFSALVDVLTSRGYLKILMNPELEVINGQTAKIRIDEWVTIDQISTIDPATGEPFLYPKRETVTDSLEITPHVFTDGSIGLKTVAAISSKSTPEGVKQIPIITFRRIDIAENRIRVGESLVIGGLRKTEQRSVVRGIPFLKDIPIIGVLFSSKDFEERGKEILFIITPTISTSGVPNEQIIADIRKKHAPPKNRQSFAEQISDPLGANIYTDLVEEEATRSEVRRVRAEMVRAQAERKTKALKEKLLETTEQIEAQRTRAQGALAEGQAATTLMETEKQKTAAAEAAKKDTDAEIAAWIKAAKERQQKDIKKP